MALVAPDPRRRINSRQQDAVEYLLTEYRVLREKLGKSRILLNDDQRGRQSIWKSLLEAHREVLTSVDVTTIEDWTRNGSVTCWLLFVMELATRRVHFAGLTANRDEGWMLQIARNLTDAEAEFLRGRKYLLMDRDTESSDAFRVILEQAGVKAVRLPARSPDLNSNLEHFTPSVNEECLGYIIFLGEKALQVATAEFLIHSYSESNHPGLGNRLIDPGEEAGWTVGEVVCRERLGGMLWYRYGEAAWPEPEVRCERD